MEKRKEPRSPNTAAKITDFKQLHVWQEARRLRTPVYRLTSTFPKEEAYGLTSPMRRAAVSITANIAEGYGRFSYQETVQFCRHSRASVYELRDHLTTALDQSYSSHEQHEEADRCAMDVVRLLNGYIRSTLRLQDEAESRKRARNRNASGASEPAP
jgi:four helix bundle protein